MVSDGIGALSKPYLIKKTVNAKAYEIEKIAQAIKDNQNGLKKIEFKEGKLSLMSFDENSLN